MTDIQKKVIRKLLELSYENGFHWFPLKMVSDLPESDLFDRNTETGLLYDIAQFGKGYVEIDRSSIHINFDLKDQLERWVKY